MRPRYFAVFRVAMLRQGTMRILLALLFFQAALITSAETTLPSYDRVRIFEPPRLISDSQLVDQDGNPFKLSQLRGRVALILFGFTNCPDVCPLTMAKFRQLQRSGDVDAEKVAFVLVSVDPERDTPSNLKAYLNKFSPEFIGLTGDLATISAIRRDFSASAFQGNPSEGGSYTVAHSTQSFVLDPQGRLRAEFYSPSIEAMAGITLALLAEKSDTPTVNMN